MKLDVILHVYYVANCRMAVGEQTSLTCRSGTVGQVLFPLTDAEKVNTSIYPKQVLKLAENISLVRRKNVVIKSAT